MSIALRHRSEARVRLPDLPGLAVRREHDAVVMAALQQRSSTEIQGRFDVGRRAYIATVNDVRAAWGWGPRSPPPSVN